MFAYNIYFTFSERKQQTYSIYATRTTTYSSTKDGDDNSEEPPVSIYIYGGSRWAGGPEKEGIIAVAFPDCNAPRQPTIAQTLGDSSKPDQGEV